MPKFTGYARVPIAEVDRRWHRRGMIGAMREQYKGWSAVASICRDLARRQRPEVERLNSLLQDPEPGTSTWQDFVAKRWKAIADLYTEHYEGNTPR